MRGGGDLREAMYGLGHEAAGPYGQAGFRIQSLLRRHPRLLTGRHCLVLGSQSPWLEAMLLRNGAGRITTVEYARLVTDHPQITTRTPAEFWPNAEPIYDCVATFSSLEHSGLGRYGDLINPWGDLQAMAKLFCVTQPGSVFLVGVPMGLPVALEDRITWNDERIYGPSRLPQLMANLHVREAASAGDGAVMMLAVRGPSSAAAAVELHALLSQPSGELGNPECWTEDFTYEKCCAQQLPGCWMGHFTAELCCEPPNWLIIDQSLR